MLNQVNEWSPPKEVIAVNDSRYPYKLLYKDGTVGSAKDCRLPLFGPDNPPPEGTKFRHKNKKEGYGRFSRIFNNKMFCTESETYYNWDNVEWIDFEEV